MLSPTAEYALRATVHLAERYDEGPVSVDDIAERLEIPRNYLSKVLHRLAKVGVLQSARGPRGGFQLDQPPEKTPLERVLRHFEPQLVGTAPVCLLGRSECRDSDPCPAHERWAAVREQMFAFFHETTLHHLARSATPTG